VLFFFCDFLHKDGSVNVPFLSACAVEFTDYLAENFKMRFNEFCSHAINLRIFENSFSIEVDDASGNLQLELLELQCDSVLLYLLLCFFTSISIL
jgi:hypothetical protein